MYIFQESHIYNLYVKNFNMAYRLLPLSQFCPNKKATGICPKNIGTAFIWVFVIEVLLWTSWILKKDVNKLYFVWKVRKK